jgi:phage major head subunit gpT-like protein
MIITTASLDALRSGFNNAYRRGLGQAETAYGRIATTVPSSTKQNDYGWLNKMPSLSEWVGPRIIHSISESTYAIKNKTFQLAIGVDRDDIEDDNLGVYDTMFVDMGDSVAAHPDTLVFGALADGFTTDGFDKQFFFDTDHPVLDANGNATTYANTDGGSGTAWYLMSTRRALKPIIFQERKKPMFAAQDRSTDESVFTNKEFRYGVDARHNVGYGFPQMAWGSKQTLNKANYKIAREALMGMTGDHGRPLGIMPDLLVVPPGLEGEGLEILNAERDAAGATNVYKGTAELLVSPWLS